MTTVAYCRGEMASDSCWSARGVQLSSLIKIQRLRSGCLLGSAGDADDRAIVDLLDNIKQPNRMPTKAALAATRSDYYGLLVFPRGKALIIEIGPQDENCNNYDAQVWETNRGIAAIGSGADIAIGAMSAGKSAREAVAIACKWDCYSRLPVHTLKL